MVSFSKATVHFGAVRENAERNLVFENFELPFVEGPNNYDESRKLFQRCLSVFAPESRGAILIITQRWPDSALLQFQTALPEFSVEGLRYLSTPGAAAILPTISAKRSELHFMTEYIDMVEEAEEVYGTTGDMISLGDSMLRRLPLAVVTQYHQFEPLGLLRPVIIINSNSCNDITKAIIPHYSNDGLSRWDRLTSNQGWIYHDLYFLFNKWDRVYCEAKLNLHVKNMEVRHRKSSTSIVEQTRQLHADTDTVLGLRELLRIHLESFSIITDGLGSSRPSNSGMEKWEASPDLDERFRHILRLLKYYEVTATEMVEQQRNLLSLAFSLETIMQGQSVAQLNALAFIFLPLSFVASIFGITTSTASPKWYPAAAVPLLMTTIAVAYGANKIFVAKPKEHKRRTSLDKGKSATWRSRLFSRFSRAPDVSDREKLAIGVMAAKPRSTRVDTHTPLFRSLSPEMVPRPHFGSSDLS